MIPPFSSIPANVVKKDKTQTLTNKTLTSPVINTGLSGTAKATGAEVTTGTNDTKFVTPKAIGDADVNTRLASKLIYATRDMAAATGDVEYTGVGFTPTAIICFHVLDATAMVGWGFADSAKSNRQTFRDPNTNFYQTENFIYEVATAGNSQTTVVKTYDADGFTLTWTKTGTPTGTIQLVFLCFR